MFDGKLRREVAELRGMVKTLEGQIKSMQREITDHERAITHVDQFLQTEAQMTAARHNQEMGKLEKLLRDNANLYMSGATDAPDSQRDTVRPRKNPVPL